MAVFSSYTEIAQIFMFYNLLWIIGLKCLQYITKDPSRHYITMRCILWINLYMITDSITLIMILSLEPYIQLYVIRILVFVILSLLSKIFKQLYIENEHLKLDEIWIRQHLSFIEDRFYNDYYAKYNGSIPSNVYESNQRYNNDRQCDICWDIFDQYSDEKEIILHCGHRFHNDCKSAGGLAPGLAPRRHVTTTYFQTSPLPPTSFFRFVMMFRLTLICFQ